MPCTDWDTPEGIAYQQGTQDARHKTNTLKLRLDAATNAACTVMQYFSGFHEWNQFRIDHPDVQQWWKEHQKCDEERENCRLEVARLKACQLAVPHVAAVKMQLQALKDLGLGEYDIQQLLAEQIVPPTENSVTPLYAINYTSNIIWYLHKETGDMYWDGSDHTMQEMSDAMRWTNNVSNAWSSSNINHAERTIAMLDSCSAVNMTKLSNVVRIN